MYPSQHFGSTPKLGHRSSSPVMSKLESIASSAVRAADKVQAALIIVYTHTGLEPFWFWGCLLAYGAPERVGYCLGMGLMRCAQGPLVTAV